MPVFKMCARAGCPDDALDGRAHCREHDRVHRQRVKTLARERGTDRDIYYTARWRTTRERVLERDGHLCTVCDREEATVVDHVGGDYSDPYNEDLLRAVCRRCSGSEDGGRRRPEVSDP